MHPKSFFHFTRGERTGLFILVSLIIATQLCYHFLSFPKIAPEPPEKRQWLALQKQIDSVKSHAPAKPKRYPFNPNFITDYKGYQLGMSVAEIDRLHAFRKTGKYVNSVQEFQDVTKVSDSLLADISPFFKFPDWVVKRQQQNSASPYKSHFREKPKIVVKDINAATKDELMAVYGIGDALSDRILKQKEILGGFVSMNQMEDVWGLQPEVIGKIRERFAVTSVPAVNKIKINDAPIGVLAKFPYFRYALAKEIVTYRSMNGSIASVDDLSKIKNFPVEKVDIIAVYLEF